MCLVNCIIVGAAKAGTTTLAQLFLEHPEICVSIRKEPDFFFKDDWQLTIPTYHDLFENSGKKIYCEASTSYTKYLDFNKELASRMFRYNSEMKLIYIVRKPLDRILSHYRYHYAGLPDRTKPLPTIKNTPVEEYLKSTDYYVDVTRYFSQIEPYLKQFGRDKVLIISFENLIYNQTDALNQIASYLKISKFKSQVHVHKNSSEYVKSISLERILTGKFMQRMKILFPKKLRRSIYHVVSRTASKRNIPRPIVSEQFITSLENEVAEEVRKIEQHLNREMTEWKN